MRIDWHDLRRAMNAYSKHNYGLQTENSNECAHCLLMKDISLALSKADYEYVQALLERCENIHHFLSSASKAFKRLEAIGRLYDEARFSNSFFKVFAARNIHAPSRTRHIYCREIKSVSEIY